jgi:Flp pilus assembly protein TadB
VSKERQRRREEREREQAIRFAARAAVREREERWAARRRMLTRWVPRPRWRPGVLARRRRRELTGTLVVLAILNIAVWVFLPTWSARLGALVVSLLVAPVLHVLLFRRP